MTIRKTESIGLDCIQAHRFSESFAIDYFCRHPYHYLYIMDHNTVIAVLSKNDIPLGEDFPSLERSFVLKAEKVPTREEIETAFRARPALSRLAVLSMSGELLCEFDDMSQPAEPRNVQKSKMALRYAPTFLTQIKNYFVASGWSKFLFIGDSKTYALFCAAFDGLDIQYAERYEPRSCDVIFNFFYLSRYKELCCKDARVIEFYKIVEKVVFPETVAYCKRRNIDLFLLRAPTYGRLTCLAPQERENFRLGRQPHDLLSDDRYLHAFAEDDADRNYLSSGEYRGSHLIDNGFLYVQSDVQGLFLTVKNGRRCTAGSPRNRDNTVYLFGSCITFGMCVRDPYTIASLLQQMPVCRQHNLRVKNQGALLGRNLLNICIDVLNTPLTRGDCIVILDIFEDYPYNTKCPILDTNAWFNRCKPADEVWFLDFPLHCNANANRLLAENIALLLQRRNLCSGNKNCCRNDSSL